jgi:hypothetical protein
VVASGQLSVGEEMKELRAGDQLIRYDREATAAAYTKIERGSAEACGCNSCRNFLAQREKVYPRSFTELLFQWGIDPIKEGDVFALGPQGNESYLYGGWLYLVGEMVEPGERLTPAPEAPSFQYFFRTSYSPPAFRSYDVAAVEFSTPMAWVLAEPWE